MENGSKDHVIDIATKFCEWLRELLTDNYERMKELAKIRSKSDHYWHQISLFFRQLEGLDTGYNRGAKRARSDLEDQIPFSDFLLLNAAADIQDLRNYFENYVETNLISGSDADNEEFVTVKSTPGLSKKFALPSAIMLTKIFQNTNSSNWKLLFGHSTAGSYSSMLRIQKRYKFHYHFTPDQRTNTVPGVDITFTGYPGILGSTDDFYIVRGRQVQSIVAGVGIKYENLELWKNANLQEALMPLVARVMAANRVAQNRKTWAKAMARHNATGCKQWITVDLNKLNPQGNLYMTLSEDEKHDDAGLKLNAADEAAINERQNRYKGLVLIAEQIPGRMQYLDVSEQFLLNGNSTWLARGVPYIEDILKASGVAPELQQVQTESQHLNAATLTELQTLESVDRYLRTNGFRGDLMGDQPVAYGNIDIKLFSYNEKEGMSDYHAFAGPIFMRSPQAPSRPSIKVAAVEGLEEQQDVLPAALQDGRLSVVIDDPGDMSEYERISERRTVRNDMRAIALLRNERKPFQWSDVNSQIAHIEHNGQPDKWDFDHVYPSWSW